MSRKQFLRSLKAYCKDTGRSYRWEKAEGKGSHGIVYVDGKKTTVKDADFPNFYIVDMLKQLGLDRDAI